MAADPTPFSKFVPGFDFMQSLAKNSGSAMPNIGQWIAPTLDPVELEKRIDELRTVQFWLEQNARMLGATIQALEVQRMTLSTLKTMNVQMNDLRDSMSIKPSPAPAAATTYVPPTSTAQKAKAASPSPPGVDPMQWWSALTKQFTELAAQAVKDGAAAVKPPSASAATAAAKPKSKTAKPAAKSARKKKTRKPAARRAKQTPSDD